MTLAKFPELISQAQAGLLKSEQAVRDFQALLDREIATVKHAIAFNPELKNEQQREAKRLELMHTPEIEALITSLNTAKDAQTHKAIELELLRNQFTVAKLAQRSAIAQLELQTPGS